MLAPHRWGACQRKDFSEPRHLHLPIHRKVLTPLTWDIWFSLIRDNLLNSDYQPFVTKFQVTWLLPSPPWSSSLALIWAVISRAWSPKDSHQIKCNSQISGCEYFLSPHFFSPYMAEKASYHQTVCCDLHSILLSLGSGCPDKDHTCQPPHNLAQPVTEF